MTVSAQCERTGSGSPGRQGCLVPAQHPCEEVKGQLRENVRVDLMMVRGGGVSGYWKSQEFPTDSFN